MLKPTCHTVAPTACQFVLLNTPESGGGTGLEVVVYQISAPVLPPSGDPFLRLHLMYLVLAAWLSPLLMSLGLLNSLVMTLEPENPHSPFNLYLP